MTTTVAPAKTPRPGEITITQDWHTLYRSRSWEDVNDTVTAIRRMYRGDICEYSPVGLDEEDDPYGYGDSGHDWQGLKPRMNMDNGLWMATVKCRRRRCDLRLELTGRDMMDDGTRVWLLLDPYSA